MSDSAYAALSLAARIKTPRAASRTAVDVALCHDDIGATFFEAMSERNAGEGAARRRDDRA